MWMNKYIERHVILWEKMTYDKGNEICKHGSKHFIVDKILKEKEKNGAEGKTTRLCFLIVPSKMLKLNLKRSTLRGKGKRDGVAVPSIFSITQTQLNPK